MFNLRFDMRVPGQTPAQIAVQYRAAIEMAQWADDKGCAGIGLSEHHIAEDGYLPSPLVLASAMAAVTKNTPIIIAAALLPMYDPVKLAEDMIVLDYISQGRVTFVFGVGYRAVEYELFGLDFNKRGAIADEKLDRLLRLLTDASNGTAVPRVTPPSFTRGRPTIVWGGGSKAAARRAGHNGLGFFAQTNTPGLGEAYAAAAREKGFEPGLCILPPPEMPTVVFVNDDLDRGWQEVGPYMFADSHAYSAWNNENRPSSSLSDAPTLEALRAENGSHRVVTVAGAVELVRRWGRLGLHPLCGGCPPDIAWPYLRRVVEDVLPAVKT